MQQTKFGAKCISITVLYRPCFWRMPSLTKKKSFPWNGYFCWWSCSFHTSQKCFQKLSFLPPSDYIKVAVGAIYYIGCWCSSVLLLQSQVPCDKHKSEINGKESHGWITMFPECSSLTIKSKAAEPVRRTRYGAQVFIAHCAQGQNLIHYLVQPPISNSFTGHKCARSFQSGLLA